MNCESVRGLISQFLESEMPEQYRRAISLHVANCPECRTHSHDLRYIRTALQRLPRLAAPKSLASRLRVIASYDRERRQGAGEFSSPLQRWLTRARLTMRDLMRPIALPAAGGLISSVLFFTMLVDTFAFQMPGRDDIPLGVFKQVTVDTVSPFGFTGREMTVELSIDKEGRVVGVSTPNAVLTREEMNHLGRLVLFTKFNPATADGQPTAGKILLNGFRINVQG